jgi:farnesyl diphosphate synthase
LGADTAQLAGDALLALAFTFLGSGDAIGDPFVRSELMLKLAQASGHMGLAGGQMLEAVFAAGTDGAPPPLPEISRLQRMKTAALTTFCCEAGAMLGKASPPARHALSAYGQDIGLAIHIAADLAGGAAGPTIVTALGAERARAQAVALSEQAVRHLDLFDEKADLLRAAACVATGWPD